MRVEIWGRARGHMCGLGEVFFSVALDGRVCDQRDGKWVVMKLSSLVCDVSELFEGVIFTLNGGKRLKSIY